MSTTQHTNPTVVLVHGLWMTPKSWQQWIDRFEQAGYPVLAPAWPGLDRPVAELNADPSPIAALDLATVVDHYERIVRGIDGPVVLMGHSFGGLIVQLLLERGAGDAGVAIDAGQPAGAYALPLSTIKAASPILGHPTTFRKAVPLTPEQFHYAFTNELSDEDSRKVYDELHVPAVGHVLWEGAFGAVRKGVTAVDYRKPDRAPLLLVAGGADHIVPAKLNRAMYRRYAKGAATVDFREYPDRTHHIVGQAGWEQVADESLAWALDHLGAHATA